MLPHVFLGLWRCAKKIMDTSAVGQLYRLTFWLVLVACRGNALSTPKAAASGSVCSMLSQEGGSPKAKQLAQIPACSITCSVLRVWFVKTSLLSNEVHRRTRRKCAYGYMS